MVATKYPGLLYSGVEFGWASDLLKSKNGFCLVKSMEVSEILEVL